MPHVGCRHQTYLALAFGSLATCPRESLLLGYSNKTWDMMPGYLSFDDLSQHIPGYPKIQQKLMGYPWITGHVTYLWVS